jgi:putative ATPase
VNIIKYLANSQAITVAVACYQACHFIGKPECNVNIAHCAAYLACMLIQSS